MNGEHDGEIPRKGQHVYLDFSCSLASRSSRRTNAQKSLSYLLLDKAVNIFTYISTKGNRIFVTMKCSIVHYAYNTEWQNETNQSEHNVVNFSCVSPNKRISIENHATTCTQTLFYYYGIK